MSPAAELHQLSRGLFIWHGYDSAVKAELFSTGIATKTGVWLVDPIWIELPVLDAALGGGSVRGIIVTNINHAREAGSLSVKLGAPVYAHPEAHIASQLPAQAEIASHTRLSSEFEVIPIDGAPRGEIAVYSSRNGGTLVIGDALINMGTYGFTFLPMKYCEDSRLMRKSLRGLLDYKFERLLLAHGTPIMTAGRQRLAALLEGDR